MVDCSTNSVSLVTENHVTATVQALADTVFEVDSVSDDELVTADQNRFDPDPVRALSHDELEAATNGKMVLGFEVEYEGCSGTPNVTFKVVTGSTVPTGARAAAYQNTPQTNTHLDTTSGTDLNQGVVTNQHEDRRWGFSATGDYGVRVETKVTLGGTARTDTETVTFDVN